MRRGALLIASTALAIAPGDARANEGTIETHVMPYAAALGVAIPRPSLYFASDGAHAAGIDLRAAPLSFVLKATFGELVWAPLVDLDVVLEDGWSRSRVRLSHGMRTTYFPFAGDADWLGVSADLGGSIGFGGPSAFAGAGLVVGGRMATIGVAYRHAWGRDESFHTLTFDVMLTYPIRIDPQR